jgi:hypothetical protein
MNVVLIRVPLAAVVLSCLFGSSLTGTKSLLGHREVTGLWSRSPLGKTAATERAAARDLQYPANGSYSKMACILLHNHTGHFRFLAKYADALFRMASSLACSASWPF